MAVASLRWDLLIPAASTLFFSALKLIIGEDLANLFSGGIYEKESYALAVFIQIFSFDLTSYSIS